MTSPSHSTRDTLADLSARAERAWDYWFEADAVGDAARTRKAAERYFYRLAQHAYLRERDEAAWCRMCAPSFQARLGASIQALCLDHADGALRGRGVVEAAAVVGETEGG